MQFDMNGITYNILLKSKEEFFGKYKEPNKEDGREYLGFHLPKEQQIWLLDTLDKGQMRRTLLHELMHCYIWCFIGDIGSINEEQLCQISSNAHDIIDSICNRYSSGAYLSC